MNAWFSPMIILYKWIFLVWLSFPNVGKEILYLLKTDGYLVTGNLAIFPRSLHATLQYMLMSKISYQYIIKNLPITYFTHTAKPNIKKKGYWIPFALSDSSLFTEISKQDVLFIIQNLCIENLPFASNPKYPLYSKYQPFESKKSVIPYKRNYRSYWISS